MQVWEWTQRHTEGGEFGAAGRDQTRPDTHPSTPATGLLHRSKCTQAILSVCLSPALNMISVCMSFSVLKKNQFWKDHTEPFLPQSNAEAPLVTRKPLHIKFGLHPVWEAGERKEHQPSLTLTIESKAGPASTPVSPWVPSQMGLVVILHKRNR